MVHPYVLTLRIMERYADVRRAMRRPYGPGLIGDVDTLIAATAFCSTQSNGGHPGRPL